MIGIFLSILPSEGEVSTGLPRSWKTWKSYGILFSNSRPGKVFEFDENGQNHGKVMEFYFPEKKK